MYILEHIKRYKLVQSRRNSVQLSQPKIQQTEQESTEIFFRCIMFLQMAHAVLIKLL